MHIRWRTLPGFKHIGTTGKSRGIEGELRLYVDDAYLEDVVRAGFLFLEFNGNKVPLEIESIREVQDLLVKFAGVNDPSAAAQWGSLQVFLPLDEITDGVSSVEEATTEYHAIVGYSVIDEQLGEIGQISEVREFPQQEMAVVYYQEREVLIPLNAVFILRIDNDQRIVVMDLPEGILEI